MGLLSHLLGEMYAQEPVLERVLYLCGLYLYGQVYRPCEGAPLALGVYVAGPFFFGLFLYLALYAQGVLFERDAYVLAPDPRHLGLYEHLRLLVYYVDGRGANAFLLRGLSGYRAGGGKYIVPYPVHLPLHRFLFVQRRPSFQRHFKSS